jgi:hypothetical protein
MSHPFKSDIITHLNGCRDDHHSPLSTPFKTDNLADLNGWRRSPFTMSQPGQIRDNRGFGRVQRAVRKSAVTADLGFLPKAQSLTRTHVTPTDDARAKAPPPHVRKLKGRAAEAAERIFWHAKSKGGRLELHLGTHEARPGDRRRPRPPDQEPRRHGG